MQITRLIKNLILILSFVAFFSFQSKAQDKIPNSRLEGIRLELSKYRQKLEDQKQKEISTLEQLQVIDREINLMHKFTRQLRHEEIQLKRSIVASNNELLGLQDEFKIQKAIFSNRVVNFYKRRKLGDLEVLLTAKSFNQVIVWVKYIQKVTEADKRRVLSLQDKKLDIEHTNKLNKAKLDAHEKILAEKNTEESRLQSKKSDKENILATVRNDTRFIAQRIEEYKLAAKEIERFLVRDSVLPPLTGRSFATTKGKLFWPVSGKIIKQFGRIKNPVTNTHYQNDGVDIRAPVGDEVRVVFPGVVSVITWLRGRGNVIMVRHVGNYYTVYTHLSEISVGYGQRVYSGDLIGRVGESDSGPMLHFEIRQSDKPINPIKWLTKNRRIVSRQL